MKLIDADKLLEWLDKQVDNAFNQDINAQDAYMITKWAAEEGKFDLTPPVQPDTHLKLYKCPNCEDMNVANSWNMATAEITVLWKSRE